MTANEFVKEHGWDYTKGIVIGVQSNFLPKNELYFQLKRLVESHELIEKQGGLISARKYIKFLQASVDIGLYHGLDNVDYKTEIPLMKQAIADVEACHA